MNFYWSNLLAWCLQIAIVVALCAAPTYPSFRFPVSRARLWYWHTVLAICLVLPILQPWAKPAPDTSAVMFSTGPFRLAATPEPTHIVISWPAIAGVILTSGIALRLLWLGIGLLRLRRYRAAAVPLEGSGDRIRDLRLAIAPRAEILVSEEILSPVTFGIRAPVVILPSRLIELSEEARISVVCHELIHIRRYDWAIAVGEELIRSIFWFHPAIWWLLGRVQLTREQVVDQEVIRCTHDPKHYLDALLAIASLRFSADLAPAPLFLKKRHLRQRVESIVSGDPMTQRNLLLPLAAALVTLPVVIGIAAWQFPLRAAPQEAVDAAGVEVQLGPAKLLHRTGITFPEEARAKNISGTVVVGLTLNDKGEVTDAAVVSGPQELRSAVMRSVLNWHFSQDSGPTANVQVAVHFDAGEAKDSRSAPEVQLSSTIKETPVTIAAVDMHRLPEALREKVEQSGVVQAGQTLPSFPSGLNSLVASLRSIDQHLTLIVTSRHEDQIQVAVMLSTPQTIRVGGNVQSANLIRQVRPKYPPEAKQARIQGLVRFNAIIGRDGTIQNLEVVEGPPELVPAAMDAVKQWEYKPTLLNGAPVEVITTIDVNFTLRQ